MHWTLAYFDNSKAFLSTRLESVFTGKVKEDELDLYYFYARFYDPWTMRFLGEDPVAPSLEQPLSLNPFVYGLNNPVMYVDYDGRENKEAAKFALENMANYKYGNKYGGKAIPVSYVKDNKITKLVCNQFVSLAYQGAGEEFPWYSYNKKNGWVNSMQSWFKD